ncbi:MAG TPA: hypothetical protein VN048_05315 [Verrucomicrobiae bacterium]|nr:hypothetical protein [Verrucomicrobiae bacterium]
MAWTKAKTAVAAGAGILLIAAMALEMVKKHAGSVQTEEQPACAGTTQMKLTGTAGAAVVGLYIQNGEMVMVSNSLPWSFTGTNISRLEFQLVRPKDAISVELVYDGKDAHTRMTEHLDAKTARLEARVENGFIVTLHQQ